MTKYDKKDLLGTIAINNDIQQLQEMINNDNNSDEIFNLAAKACIELDKLEMLKIIFSMSEGMGITWSELLHKAAMVCNC